MVKYIFGRKLHYSTSDHQDCQKNELYHILYRDLSIGVRFFPNFSTNVDFFIIHWSALDSSNKNECLNTELEHNQYTVPLTGWSTLTNKLIFAV